MLCVQISMGGFCLYSMHKRSAKSSTFRISSCVLGIISFPKGTIASQKMEETAAARSAAGTKGAEKRWGKSNNDSKNSKEPVHNILHPL